jgi:hypothetical protein
VSPARECPLGGKVTSVSSVAVDTSLGAQLEVNLKMMREKTVPYLSRGF